MLEEIGCFCTTNYNCNIDIFLVLMNSISREAYAIKFNSTSFHAEHFTDISLNFQKQFHQITTIISHFIDQE